MYILTKNVKSIKNQPRSDDYYYFQCARFVFFSAILQSSSFTVLLWHIRINRANTFALKMPMKPQRRYMLNRVVLKFICGWILFYIWKYEINKKKHFFFEHKAMHKRRGINNYTSMPKILYFTETKQKSRRFWTKELNPCRIQ